MIRGTGFWTAGRTVLYSTDGGTCRLFIGDDGPGMPVHATSRGGVGMQLIAGLTRQIRARCEWSAGPGVGTTIVWEQ